MNDWPEFRDERHPEAQMERWEREGHDVKGEVAEAESRLRHMRRGNRPALRIAGLGPGSRRPGRYTYDAHGRCVRFEPRG